MKKSYLKTLFEQKLICRTIQNNLYDIYMQARKKRQEEVEKIRMEEQQRKQQVRFNLN